jgi:hypothetical protein
VFGSNGYALAALRYPAKYTNHAPLRGVFSLLDVKKASDMRQVCQSWDSAADWLVRRGKQGKKARQNSPLISDNYVRH